MRTTATIVAVLLGASACATERSRTDTTHLDSIDDSAAAPAEQTSGPVPTGTTGGTRSAESTALIRHGRDSVRMPLDTQGLSRDTLTAEEMIKRRPPERRLPPPPIRP